MIQYEGYLKQSVGGTKRQLKDHINVFSLHCLINLVPRVLSLLRESRERTLGTRLLFDEFCFFSLVNSLRPHASLFRLLRLQRLTADADCTAGAVSNHSLLTTLE